MYRVVVGTKFTKSLSADRGSPSKEQEEFSDFICSVGGALTVQLYRTHHLSSLVRFKIPNPQTFVPRAPVQA